MHQIDTHVAGPSAGAAPRLGKLALAIGLGLLGVGSSANADGLSRLQNLGQNTLQPGAVRIHKIRDALPLTGTPSPSSVILVTNLDDDGPGSLRAAILAANLTPFVADEIRFDPALAGGVLTLTSGSLLIASGMTIRNPSLVPIGITSAPDLPPPPAPSGTLPTTNDGRLFLIDDGNDEINSRVSFEGLDMFGAIVVDEVPVPGPHGATGVDETAAIGAAILSAESVEIRRSRIFDNTNYSTLAAYAIGSVFAQGDLIVEDSTVRDNLVVALKSTGGTAVSMGPLAAFPNQSTANPGETIRPGYLRIERSTLTQNRTYAINNAPIATALQAFPSTVVGGNMDVSHATIVENVVAAVASGGPAASVTESSSRSAALLAQLGSLSLSDSTVSGNLAFSQGATSAIYAGAITVYGGAALNIARSDISDNTAYATAGNSAGNAIALSYAAAVLGLAGYSTISDSTLSNNVSVAGGATSVDGSAGNESASSTVYALGAATLLGNVGITNSTITGNSATAQSEVAGTTGGAFNLTLSAESQAWGGGLTLAQPAAPIAPGDAVLGGGAFPFVLSSTISNNTASSATFSSVTGSTTGTLVRTEEAVARGGGIAALDAPFNLPGLGAVLFSGNSISASASLPASTTELGPEVHGNSISAFNNLIGDPTDSNIFDGANNNVVGLTDLEPLKHNGGPTRTRALVPGSIAIDAGFNPFFISADQRGYGPREVGPAADIGAYECGATPSPGGDDNDLFIDDFDPSC